QHDLKIGVDVRREVFLIFKEAVNNIIRHSGCSEARIEFLIQGGWIEMTLTDNGRGFDVAQASERNGVISMRQRALKLSGSLDISSNKGLGTTLRLRTPLKRAGWLKM